MDRNPGRLVDDDDQRVPVQDPRQEIVAGDDGGGRTELLERTCFGRIPLDATAMRSALTVKAEEWMASEGVRVLERVAREMFPRIAEGVLRREIDKLKAEMKEKE